MTNSKFLMDTTIRSNKRANVKVTKEQEYFDKDSRRIPSKEDLYPPMLKMTAKFF